MKGPILLHKNTKSHERSFVCRYARVPHLYNSWHYHRELELLYVIRGDGTRFVGDSILPFDDGDLVLVGSNLPHFWQSNPHYFEGHPNVYSELILTQFLPDLLGDGFLLSELHAIRDLIARAQHGIRFGAATVARAATILWRIVEATGGRRIILLLELLDLLATAPDAERLSNFTHQRLLTDDSSIRLKEVCDYLLQHYLSSITLAEVAARANMSEKAFCRFFRAATQKTVMQFVRELRLSHACKLLVAGELSIGEVGFASGFTNQSNFNRQFKQSLGCTPREYRRRRRA